VKSCYDGAGRAKEVQDVTGAPPKSYAAVGQYAPQGAIESLTLGNGVVEQRGFNERLQMTSIAATKASTLLSLTYAYGTTNNNGNVLSQAIQPLNVTQTYGYDSYNRLLSAAESGGGWTQNYVYDGRGNRAVGPNSYVPVSVITPQTPDQTVPYNGNNQWTGATYDAAGNLTGQPERTYSYDGENRLVTATGPGGAVTYRYDGEGRRVKKELASGTTVYVYDAQGRVAAEYGAEADTGTKYVTADHLGSTRLVTDNVGAVTARYDPGFPIFAVPR
jgi:YD repeat-containing protein